MREIEIKARIEDLGSIVLALQQRGAELSERAEQHDVVWGVEGAPSGNNTPWLRLRTEIKGNSTHHIFTLKRSVTNQLDSIEHETEVSDPVELASIVRELGFTLYSDIKKNRQKTKLGDIEICLDTVEGLGEFIEAEKLTDDDVNYEVVVGELWALFAELGVDRTDEVTEGYDVLMNKKLGKE